MIDEIEQTVKYIYLILFNKKIMLLDEKTLTEKQKTQIKMGYKIYKNEN